ncbi:MAG: 2-oxoglutarate dehydrogenase, E2 component, dihydrolipoamide succinyltransferase [Ignavibacteriae bacterium HGW-Ignavibacteriae-4]|jgi:2-oxoglutarate dehydrogenase E2 component (dihydrolipoamide succinyltransferase)|nr:MAG: 2-oxoglutarate dehydrogenase, E2 component, dihydrolipoamide succinyltransferase [Ignavibacteriae bacterium HGW-Ignavibacteriae-4]
MKVDVVMPKMGESLQEGTIIKWLKKEGDKIERDEMILEISTDKVDTEVPSPQSGILTRILAQEEEVVEVGKKIAEIETDASAAATSTPEPAAQVEAPAPVQQEAPAPAPQQSAPAESSSSDDAGNLQDLVMPKMGESLQEGTITKWLKKEGDTIERDEMILEISTDKVDTEVPSPVAGVLYKILAQEEETVEVGSVIGKIATSGGAKKPAAQPAQEAPKPVAQVAAAAPQPVAQTTVQHNAPQVQGTTFDIPRKNNGKFFSPLVRALAKDNNISLEELMNLNGSGLEGRITKEDLENYISNRGSRPAQTAAPAPTQQAAPAPVSSAPSNAPTYSFSGGDSEIIPMDRMRQLISEHMVRSKQTSAHVTSVAEVDVTGIVNYREKTKNEFLQREGMKLTYTPFFIKAVVDAIKLNPMVNVSVDGKNIIKHNRLNLGFATALPDGNLIVPVIKNADNYGLTGLQRSVNDLAHRARTKKLLPDDIQGGTITMTNVGTFGTLFGTPVINQPQVAIMGVGAIKKRAMVMEVDGSHAIVIRDMMYCSITYDHRVVDGMLAGQTLKAFVDTLESMNENTIVL